MQFLQKFIRLGATDGGETDRVVSLCVEEGGYPTNYKDVSMIHLKSTTEASPSYPLSGRHWQKFLMRRNLSQKDNVDSEKTEEQ